jgi:hypothetical protein
VGATSLHIILPAQLTHPTPTTPHIVELCMSEAQARSVLCRCPALCELDVRLAQRRLRQLDAQLHISRGDAALLVLRHPQQLLPAVADVVEFALRRRAGAGGTKRPPSS